MKRKTELPFDAKRRQKLLELQRDGIRRAVEALNAAYAAGTLRVLKTNRGIRVVQLRVPSLRMGARPGGEPNIVDLLGSSRSAEIDFDPPRMNLGVLAPALESVDFSPSRAGSEPERSGTCRDLGASSERALHQHDQPTRKVRATVVALLPEYRQAQVRSVDGDLFALTDHTGGVSWTALHEGQQVQATVALSTSRVLWAELVA